ncbi:MAG: LacI family transcriptional regulator, partial [Mesorhizobium sp.]
MRLRVAAAGSLAIPKPTFLEIARRAGVGTATVERVLNGRGGVRPETVEKVVAAARLLDYPRRLPEAHRGVIRIEVILVRPDATFFARLSRAFERIAATLDRSIAVHRTFLDEANPAEIAARILDPEMRRAGLILAVPDHPLVSAALRKLEADNIPTVQIVTQISGTRSTYVGIDNYAAGRTVGLLMARMQRRPGKVVAICH